MGSTGKGFLYTSKDAEAIGRMLRKQQEQSKSHAYEAAVNDTLNRKLVDINNRNVEAIQQHLNTLMNAIEKEIEGTLDLRYGGSVSKHTYVDGLSDIDSLVLLNNSSLSKASPSEVKEYFYECVRHRLPNSTVSVGRLAITVKFSDGFTIQILPAIRVNSYYRIPNPSGENTWSRVNPRRFALKLKSVNQRNGGKVVPVIKLAKSIISSFPEKRKLSGYHVESLAIDAFRNYTGDRKTKPMLEHLFQSASKAVLSPISDSSGQSVHVDEYLGKPNSIDRKMASDSLSRVYRQMKNSDAASDIRFWRQLL